MASLSLGYNIHRRSSTTSTISNRSSICDFPYLDPTEFTFDCIYPDCALKFKLTGDLYDHIREHNKVLLCPICDSTFKCMASLVYHVRTHTGNKPYCCPLPVCQFITATKGNLKAHLLSNQHKDAMSVDLLNAVLSLDTKHGRPERSLHGPRERKNKRKTPISRTQHAFTFEPARKRNRLSLGHEHSSNHSLSSLDDGQRYAMPLAPPTPFAGNSQPVYYAHASPVDRIGPTHNTRSYYSDNTYVDALEPKYEHIDGNHNIRSPATSLAYHWQDLNLMPSHYEDAAEEDLTVRVNISLLKDDQESFPDISGYGESDKFSMGLDGVDTNQYYRRSRQFSNSVFSFGSRSNSIPRSRRTSMDDLDFDLIPPLDF